MNNITFVKGNIFNTKAQTVVNTVNCVGVMGKGIALVYKLRYPKGISCEGDRCIYDSFNFRTTITTII